MDTGNDLVGLMLNNVFVESVAHYPVDEMQFKFPINAIMPHGWILRRKNLWFSCYRPPLTLPREGWKIHVSSTIEKSRELLLIVAQYLFRTETVFKFALDPYILALLNNKRWSRGGFGKFITIYPGSDEKFKAVLENLNTLTQEFRGPYILSDARYGGSRVLFYRFGQTSMPTEVGLYGVPTREIVAPTGRVVLDERKPYHAVADDAADIITGAQARTISHPEVILNRRYAITQAMSFSSAGGVYLARDLTSDIDVVLKEARPDVQVGPTKLHPGEDAQVILRREYNILQKLERSEVTPKPVDYFVEWEHEFLVQEYIHGMTMSAFATPQRLCRAAHLKNDDEARFYKVFRTIFSNVARALAVLHDEGVVFRDLSSHNVLVNPESLETRFIDLETAFATGLSQVRVHTPGFGSPEQLRGDVPTPGDDYYSLGALMLYYITGLNAFIKLGPDRLDELLRVHEQNFGLAGEIRSLIVKLLGKPKHRPSLAQILGVLTLPKQGESISYVQRASDEITTTDLIRRTAEFIVCSATPEREDRLFPCSAIVFESNPLSVAFGAYGVLYALHKCQQTPPEKCLQWPHRFPLSLNRYPPGLAMGLSGIAWVLLELGHRQEAEEAMSLAGQETGLEGSIGILYGLSGWGLANLLFFLRTHDQSYLDRAEAVGRQIVALKSVDHRGSHWPGMDEGHCGWGYGASGVALFFLYLYRATGKEVYFQEGKSALAFDLSQQRPTEGGGVAWPRRYDESSSLSSGLLFGTAGIGMVVARYHRVVSGDYPEILDRMLVDVGRPYAFSPGYFNGLSGILTFLTDVHRYTGKRYFLQAASKVVDGIKLFAMRREGGLGFPGDSLLRINCDFASGSAGVMTAIYRMERYCAPLFCLDELLESGSIF